MKSWGRGNHNQNILSEKKSIFNRKEIHCHLFSGKSCVCVCLMCVVGDRFPRNFKNRGGNELKLVIVPLKWLS